jgi:leucyl/phenylalanyl-tRNA--protein transferase
MTVFLLREDLNFPPAELADEDGLLAVGGDLSEKRILIAYKNGIFPWYNCQPILWWSPPKRPVIFPRFFNMSKSLFQTLKKNKYNVTFDKNFVDVINACASVPRKNSTGTWLTSEMIEAYIKLHKLGYAHSVEVWFNKKLVGGLYGVSIGKAFFGESMFTIISNASKVATACLVEFLIQNTFYFIDCQVTNPHLLSLGAIELPRAVFLKILNEAVQKQNLSGKWKRNNDSTYHTALFLKEKLIKRKIGDATDSF